MSLGRVFLHNINMKSILINSFFSGVVNSFLKSFSHINQLLQIKKKVLPLESTHHITLKIIIYCPRVKTYEKELCQIPMQHIKNVTARSRHPLAIIGSLRTCS